MSENKNIILPNDVARCNGSGWDECDDCLRRTSKPSGDRVVMMSPPDIIAFECEFYITPNVTCDLRGNQTSGTKIVRLSA